MPSYPTLSARQLNRASLIRQLLDQRAALSVPQAVAALMGLQSQVARPPYVGLWTRLQGATRDTITQAMLDKQVVRASLIRSTIHLFTAEDFLAFRTTIQPALTKGLQSFHGKDIRGWDITPVIDAAQAFFSEQPHTFAELRPHLLNVAAHSDEFTVAYIARAMVPLVQVPPAGTWNSGAVIYYATPEEYLGQSIDPHAHTDALFCRYLRAFGPASLADFQTWSGIPNVKTLLTPTDADYMIYQGVGKELLYDVPEGVIPDVEMPVPVRFLPDYDNYVLAHKDRTRVLPDAFRKQIFVGSAIVRPTILVDGMVAGTWKIEKSKKAATLVISPFEALTHTQQIALNEEAEQLVRFVEDKADQYDVRFEAPIG